MNEEETKVEEVKVEEAKAEVTETTNEEAAESKKGMDVVALIKKNLKWIAIAVAALILICIIGSCASGKDRYTRFADRGECFERVEEDQLVLSYPQKKIFLIFVTVKTIA